MAKVKFDNELIREKILEVSGVLDGTMLPTAMSIIGGVVINLVACAEDEGVDVRPLFVNWLRRMADVIEDDEEEDDEEEDDFMEFAN